MRIPRIFHHVWTSGDEMSEAILSVRQTWIDRHPEWDLRIWRLEDLAWLRNRALFERAETYAQKADIARYEIVHRFGGVYLDTDMECLRPLDSLLDELEFFAARQYDGYVAIGIFGATVSHPILRDVVDRLPARTFFHPGGPIYVQTGPVLFDTVLREGRWEERSGIRIFPAAYFYPYDPSERLRRHESFDRAYAVHHWDHSWKGGMALRARPAELLPQRDEPVLPFVKATWQEGREFVTEASRKQVEKATRRVRAHARGLGVRAARRFLPATPPSLHGIPWGPGEVLVDAPFGTRLLSPIEDLSLTPELALTGIYDRPFVDFLWRRLQPGMTFVDVGANIGLFTIAAAARVGSIGRVFAYECNPELIGYLRRNVEMNWFEDRVVLIAKAAHRDNDDRRFLVPCDRKALGSLTRFDANDPRGLLELQVSCERLDGETLTDVPFIDLLKVDVEGGEAAVLEGASGLLDRGKIGVMSIEYRESVMREELREEMEKQLTSLAQDLGATFHVPGDSRSIPLDEVLIVFDYTQLLIRLPGRSIEP